MNNIKQTTKNSVDDLKIIENQPKSWIFQIKNIKKSPLSNVKSSNNGSLRDKFREILKFKKGNFHKQILKSPSFIFDSSTKKFLYNDKLEKSLKQSSCGFPSKNLNQIMCQDKVCSQFNYSIYNRTDERYKIVRRQLKNETKFKIIKNLYNPNKLSRLKDRKVSKELNIIDSLKEKSTTLSQKQNEVENKTINWKKTLIFKKVQKNITTYYLTSNLPNYNEYEIESLLNMFEKEDHFSRDQINNIFQKAINTYSILCNELNIPKNNFKTETVYFK